MENKMTKLSKILALLMAAAAMVAILFGYSQHWLIFTMFIGVWLFINLIEEDTNEKEKDYYE